MVLWDKSGSWKNKKDEEMTVQQLKYILKVAEVGSITEAAKLLFISQPSLSNSIKETEKEAGITIFLRSRIGITLTKDGAEFLGYARQVIQQMELLEDRYVTNLPGKVTSRHAESDRGKPAGVYRAVFSKASCFFAKRSPIGIEKSSFRS